MAVGVNRLSSASAYKIYLAGPKGQTHIYCLPKGPTKYCADPEGQQNIVLTQRDNKILCRPKGPTKYCADSKGHQNIVVVAAGYNNGMIISRVENGAPVPCDSAPQHYKDNNWLM